MKQSRVHRFIRYMLLSFLVAFITEPQSLFAGFYEDSKIEGFYFFEDPKDKEKLDEREPQTPEEAAEKISKQKEELYNLRCLAILSPTNENLIHYIEEHNRIIALSDRFAERWQHILFDVPELGEEYYSTTSAIGIEARKKAQETKKLQTLDSLGEKYFLLLFIEGGDVYSEEAAKVLKQFSSVTEWETRAISLNGQSTAAFPNPEVNRGLAEKFNITKSPSFLLVNPETKEGYPIGVGVLSIVELIDNIYKQSERYQLEARK